MKDYRSWREKVLKDPAVVDALIDEFRTENTELERKLQAMTRVLNAAIEIARWEFPDGTLKNEFMIDMGRLREALSFFRNLK